MEIKYLGHAAFQIKTKTARIVTDPFDSSTGLKFPKTEADIITVSHAHPDHNAIAEISGNPQVLDWPGEFEKNQVRIFGYQTFHDDKNGAERGENVMFKFEAEEVVVLHCGDLGHTLSNDFVDKLEGIDILLLPVGGIYTIDPVQAAAIVKQIDPSIVVPMHYGREQLDQKTFGQLAPLDEFMKKMGVGEYQPLDKLIIRREDLTGDDLRIIPLIPSA